MPNNRDSHTDFGTGFDWEDGAYPTPPKYVRRQIAKKVEAKRNRVNRTKRASSRDTSDSSSKPGNIRDSDETESSIKQFQGVLLSVVPPYVPYNSEEDIRIASLFLGNGQRWARVTFWGDTVERVADFDDTDSNPTLEVTGITSDKEGEFLDLHILGSDDRTYIKRTDEGIRWMVNPISIESIEAESLVEMVRAEVIASVSDTHENSIGERFQVQHLSLYIGSKHFVAELHDCHVNQSMNVGDIVYIFAGWGKDKDEFIHNDLPDVGYEGKFWVRNYSGIRNISQNPLDHYQ